MWVVSWVVDYTSFIILSNRMAFDIVRCEYLIGAEGTPWGFVCNPNVMPEISSAALRLIGKLEMLERTERTLECGVSPLVVGALISPFVVVSFSA
jgi:hypothetical protein